MEFGLNGNIVEAGAVVTIVGRLDAETGVLRARSVHLVDKTLKRLRAHIEEIRETALERKDQIKHVARVQDLLEEASSRQLKIVSELLDRLPEEAHAGLERALSNIDPEDVERLLSEMSERIRKQIEKLVRHNLKPDDDDRERGEPDRPDRPDVRSVRTSFDLALVARILGMSEDALFARLKEGGTLSDIARQNGVGLDDLVAKLTEAMKRKLAEMVEEGRIEPDRARQLLQEARERLIKSIREFRQETIDRPAQRSAWSPSARLYKNIPVTAEDVAGALGITVAELQKWMHQDDGVRLLLEEP